MTRDDLIDKEVAEKLSKEVVSYIIEQGKISNNGTSYCYLTVFGNICVETQQYRKTPCFRVYKEENKEE